MDTRTPPPAGEGRSSAPRGEDALVERWDADIRRAAGRRARDLGRHTEASDLAQEARLRVVLAARASPVESERYTRKVIANAILGAALRGRRWSEMRPLTDETPVPTTDDDALEDSAAVRLWASGLPSALRAIYRVLYGEGRTQREAASALGISQPRVAQLHQVLLAHARSALTDVAA